MQIDILNIIDGIAVGNLQTGDRDIRIGISESDYKKLISDGFFIRDGESKDSAGVLNTTKVYTIKSGNE